MYIHMYVCEHLYVYLRMPLESKFIQTPIQTPSPCRCISRGKVYAVKLNVYI